MPDIPNSGAMYNALNKNGLPILGHYARAAEAASFDKDGMRLKADTFFVPNEGINKIELLFTNTKNELIFTGTGIAGWPAHAFFQDLRITFILVFLYDTTQWPMACLNNISKKWSWQPQWLEKTEMGKTLADCQQLASTLIFEPELFDFAARDDFLYAGTDSQDLYGRCLTFYDSLKRLRESCRLDPEKHDVRFRWLHFYCEPIKISVLASNPHTTLYELAIKERGHHFCIEVFDRETGQLVQPITTHLFNHRDALPVLLPALDRLRQLQNLLHGILAVKNAGYAPGAEDIASHQEYLKRLLQEQA